jgi:hypothetical protein
VKKTDSVVILFACLSAVTSHREAAAEGAPAGNIIGHIDGIASDDGGAHIKGWACQQGRPESLTVHIYANGSANESAKGTLALAGKADLDNEAGVDTACRDSVGRKHRFDIPLPAAVLNKFRGMPLYVHGIRVAGSVENAAIDGSGTTRFPNPPPTRQRPTSFPRLSGRYESLAMHPRVFVTQRDLADMAQRAGRAGSYSRSRYAALADKVRADMTSTVDWNAAYSGCDLEIYLRGFSYEQKPAYGNDRSADDLSRAMNVQHGSAPPHGAAIVAARAALYASLVKAGAPNLPGAPSATDAAAFAKRILLAWADRGFRDATGAFRGNEEGYCDLKPDGSPVVSQFGKFYGALTLTRGVIYSVHAQDLLQGKGALSQDEQTRLDAFHRNMLETIRAIHNKEYEIDKAWKYSDEIYNNQFVGHMTAFFALARLFDDEEDFDAALNGGTGDHTVRLPWIALFDGVIYGENDAPYLNITPNSSVDPEKSHPAYSTAIVAPGEVNDRYRHSNPSQPMGYATGSLEGLYMAAEVLRGAGYDPYSYRGTHGQSLDMASRYYGCFAKAAGFDKVVTPASAGDCPDGREYRGAVVNGVAPTILIGTYRYPDDKDLAALDAAAKASFVSSVFSFDPIMFGKWRD